MDAKEFVKKLFLLYPNSYNSANEFLKKRQYAVALDNDKVDFELLFDRIAKYHDDDFMPPSAWLKEQSKFCYKSEIKKASYGLIHVKVYDPKYDAIVHNDCFPQGVSEDVIIKTYEKITGCTGWKIIEIR